MAKLSRIAPELPTVDLQAAIQHYVQKLGFRCSMRMPEGDYAIVERDDVAIHLFQDTSRSHLPVGVHIFTAELDDRYAELQQRGASFSQGIMQKPWGTHDFRLNDEFGNVLKFTESLQQRD